MTLRFFECTGPDQYELVTSIDSVTTPVDLGALDGVGVADVNSDGINELYIAGSASEGLDENNIYIITNTSDISLLTKSDVKFMYKIPVKALGGLRTMQIADPDNDGLMDLMVAGEKNGQIYDLEYKGSGDPADSANWELNTIFDVFDYSGLSPDSANTISPRFFYGYPANDMDNDGKDEYVFVNFRSSFLVWENDKYLYILENDQVVGVENPNDKISNSFTLEQNYPNPFNPITTIKYEVPSVASGSSLNEIQLKVYDVLGKEVATLVDGYKQSGSYGVDFDAEDLSSGVYYYTLKTNGNLITKKMMLIK